MTPRWRLSVIRNLLKFKVLTAYRIRMANQRHRANFFGVKLLPIWRSIDFFANWWPSAIFELSETHWNHRPRREFGGFYRCAKFGWNRFSSFDNMIGFCAFNLKTLTHAQNKGFGGFATEMGSNALSTTTKKAHPSVVAHHTTYRSLTSVHPFLSSSPIYSTLVVANQFLQYHLTY